MEQWNQYQKIYESLKRLTAVVDTLVYKLNHYITGKSYAGFCLIFKALWCIYQWVFKESESWFALDRCSFFSPLNVADEDNKLLNKLSNAKMSCAKKRELFHSLYPISFALFEENCCCYDEYMDTFINNAKHWRFETQEIYSVVTTECDDWLEGIQEGINGFFENWEDDEYVVTPENLAVYKDILAIGLEDYLGDAAGAVVEALLLEDPAYFYTVTNGNIAIYNEFEAFDFYGNMLQNLFVFDGDDSTFQSLLKDGYLSAVRSNFSLENVSDDLLVELMYKTEGDIVYFNALQYQDPFPEYFVFQSTSVAYLLHVDIHTVPIFYQGMVQWWRQEVSTMETPLVPYRIEKQDGSQHHIAVVSDKNTYLVSGYVGSFQGEFQEFVNRYCPNLRNLCLLEMADYLYDILHEEKE